MPKTTLRLGFVIGFLGAILAAEIAVRIATPILARPLAWYAQQAQVKADDLSDHAGEVDWAPVVFVGSSSTRDAFDPSLFRQLTGCDLDAYNAGLTGLRPRALEHFLSEWVLPMARPRVVVYGFTTNAINVDGSDEFWNRYREAAAVRTGRVAEFSRTLARLSALWRYRATIRDPVYLKPTLDRILPWSEPIEPWKELVDGYADPGRSPYHLGTFTMEHFEPSEVEARAFSAVLDTSIQSGAETWAVLMPTSPDYRRSHDRARVTFRDAANMLERRVRASGARFLDLAEVVPPEGFQDAMHVNTDGAGIVTMSIVEAMGDICGRLQWTGR